MATFDVREEDNEVIDEIKFANYTYEEVNVASHLRLDKCYDGFVDIVEGEEGDYVRISSKQHAQSLIKALNKAIELGWLK